MKATEWATPFTHERSHETTEWMSEPVSYDNRQLMQAALGNVGPQWVGFSAAKPELAADMFPPPNPMNALPGYDSTVTARDIVHEGGWDRWR